MTRSEERYLSFPEASRKYGVAVSTLYGWKSSQKLKPPIIVKVGRLVRIRESLFEEWLDEETKAQS